MSSQVSGAHRAFVLQTLAWGNSSYFILVFHRSQIPVSDLFSSKHIFWSPRSCFPNSPYFIPVSHRSQIPDSDRMNCFEPFPVTRICFSQLALRYSSDSPESNPLRRSDRLSTHSYFLGTSHRGNLPYLTRLIEAVKLPDPIPAPRTRAAPCFLSSCLRARRTKACLVWWVCPRGFGRCVESFPCRVPHPSRLRERYARLVTESNRLGCDRGHDVLGPNATAPTVRLPRRVMT